MKAKNTFWLASLLVFACWTSLLGQDTMRIDARIDLIFYQVNDDIPYLTTRVRTLTNKGWFPVQGVIVNLFLNEESKLGMMGNIISDPEGAGKYILPDKFRMAWDSLEKFTFTARILNDNNVNDIRKVITIKKCRLEIDTREEDSVRTLSVSFKEKQGKEWVGVFELELKPFVKRTFGRLPIGEDTLVTNEDGFAEVEFSSQIPGDEYGNLTLGWLLEDHDDYGNIKYTKSVAWGLPLVKNTDFFNRRTLWSSRERTPIWLLIGPNAMILLVWGVIVYLLYQIVLIKRIHKNNVTK